MAPAEPGPGAQAAAAAQSAAAEDAEVYRRVLEDLRAARLPIAETDVQAVARCVGRVLARAMAEGPPCRRPCADGARG